MPVFGKISETLARKWSKTNFQIMEWVHVQIQLLSIVGAVPLRLRGMRKKIRSLPFENGAVLPYI